MHTCEFCGSLIPDYASFCGQCGRVPSKAMETRTMASDFHVPDVQNIDTATIASVSGNFQPNSVYNQQSFISNTPTTLLSQEEEEERRRRAAILGMSVPLLGSLAVEGMPNAGNVPMVQGTPQIGGVPTVQAPQLPSSIPVSPLPATTVTLHHPHHPHHKAHGCSLVFIIAAILIPV